MVYLLQFFMNKTMQVELQKQHLATKKVINYLTIFKYSDAKNITIIKACNRVRISIPKIEVLCVIHSDSALILI